VSDGHAPAAGAAMPPGDGSAVLRWHGETLELLADHAVHWPRRRTLLVADPHFGKAAAFRAAGVPVPAGTTGTDTQRLSRLLQTTGAHRLIVLGDFLHAAAGRAAATMTRLAEWRAAHADLEIVLVIGNHDVAAGLPPDEWRIRCVRGALHEAPFSLRHDPQHRQPDDSACIAGHVHPVVALEERSGARLRAPCFVFGEHVALLPSFGTFTGGSRYTPTAGERIFVVGDEAVVEVSPSAAARGGGGGGRHRGETGPRRR
jgi:uncharacterized protein